MRRYLDGLMDPFVTLLEVHKLMYFMQEAGEPLRLRYERGPYGPYAENLRHVLREIEGYFVSGYANGGDAPDKELTLVPGAVDDAETYLAHHPDTRAHFERVAELVEGFETSFGLELLSTVHWLALAGDARGRSNGKRNCRRRLRLERSQEAVLRRPAPAGVGRVDKEELAARSVELTRASEHLIPAHLLPSSGSDSPSAHIIRCLAPGGCGTSVAKMDLRRCGSIACSPF